MPGERFIDTNVLIRHLTGDHPEQSLAATALLVRIERGEERCWIADVTVAECVWVLTGAVYRVPRAALVEMLSPVVALPGLRLAGRARVLTALEIYATTNLNFVDSYHAAAVATSGSREFYSFDRGFDRLPGLRRLEPPPVEP